MHIIKEMAILQEAKDVQVISSGKVRFKAKLQLMDEYSYNGKKYLRQPMMQGVQKKERLLKQNGFLGEMDHPMDPTMMRLVNVLYKEASHLFKEIYTEGNTIWGVMENTSTKVGMDLYALIVKDKIPVGFSLRAMGDIRDTNQGIEVFDNIDITTWDCVSTPSYSSCILQEVLTSRQHLESYMMNNDVANLEDYVHGDTSFRREMVLESKLSMPTARLISKIENAYLVDEPDVLVKSIRRSLKIETRQKIFLLK